jgi:glutamate synthase (NADPH/NADH) small chain
VAEGGKINVKERMALERQAMPQRDPSVRNRDFDEVNLGFDEQLARLEARRCLGCKDAPCMRGCPVNVKIPEFLAAVEAGRFEEAARILYSDNDLPALAGRVCPQEIQCEGLCVRCKKGRSVAIGHIERFIADWYRARNEGRTLQGAAPAGGSKAKVAVVGSGPAGLTAAGQLARMGYQVTIFEAFHRPGGVLVYGIPEFRLPKAIVDAEVRRLTDMGVQIRCNTVIGKSCLVTDLLNGEGFSAVFLAVGAGLPQFMNVPGENLKGVYSANEYLTRVNLMGAYRHDSHTPIHRGRAVAVIGGGNTAMDSVRTAKRLGAERAMIVYRRGEAELPARIEEVHHAKEEGIEFHFLAAPERILGDEKRWVSGLECVRMELTEPGADGRRKVRPIAGTNFVLACDTVVVAIGTNANPLLTGSTAGLALNKWGYIQTNEDGMTNLPGVFAGGDIVRGSATVILAMGDGKRAASAIDRYLRSTAGAGEAPGRN